ncbi:hypothetical protein [Spirosoma sp.]|uniref:hypothetical protein n=1 Tax=Spirosoma sp. TaxID=1899569 RepID=UPI003B3AFA57
MKGRNTNLIFTSIIVILLLFLLVALFFLFNSKVFSFNKDVSSLIEAIFPEIIGTVFGLVIFYVLFLIIGKPFSSLVENDGNSIDDILNKIDNIERLESDSSQIIKAINNKFSNYSVQFIDKTDTESKHLWALKDTKYWYSNGHIGRWIRFQVIPHLAKKSIEEMARRDLKIILLNPDNEQVCKEYWNYRLKIESTEGIFTILDVKAEILSTITISYFYKSKSNIDVSIYLNNVFSVFREDISSKATFRTLIRKDCPAIMYLSGSNNGEFYNASLSDFDFARKKLAEFDSVDGYQAKELTKEGIKAFLLSTNIVICKNLPDDLLDNIFKRCTVPTNHHRKIIMNI